MTTTYTDPSVLRGIADGAEWADPVMDPAEIDWTERQARAAIPFKLVNGRPLNPFAPTGIRYGRNEFGHWGEALMADALVTVTLPPWGTRYLLMVEREDGHGWAVPGGHVDEGEGTIDAALRELEEETGLIPADMPPASPSWTGQRPCLPATCPTPGPATRHGLSPCPFTATSGCSRRRPQ
jgi:hypothetical protein